MSRGSFRNALRAKSVVTTKRNASLRSGVSRPELTMPKYESETSPETRAALFERRRIRRIRMIVELTLNLISSDMTVSHREARSLVDCARKAILDLLPSFDERYERVIRPHFERILQERWPAEELRYSHAGEIVN
jgi:hypothetical protein